MCGRLVQSSPAERLSHHFAAVDTIGPGLGPRYNVAPSTPVAAIIDVGERRLGPLQWGFVPSWSPSPDSGPRPINARSEGAATSRLFASALSRRRCIVPVDAWYEWADEDGARQPWLLAPDTAAAGIGSPVAIAALWSMWRADTAQDAGGTPGTPGAGAHGQVLSTVALMTTAATGRAAEVHHRMPLIVPDDLLGDWLDPERTSVDDLLGLLAARDVPLRTTRVSRRVNDVRNDDADLLGAVTG